MRHGLGFHNRHSAGGFQPISLFTGGVQGAWYDPSDFGASGTGGVGTLFQDSAGTTPVTAVEQAVGLMLDKSKGLVLGSELVTNGTFASGTTGWTLTGGGTFTASNGIARLQNPTTPLAEATVYATITTVVGRWYTFVFTLAGSSAGQTLSVRVGTSAGGTQNATSTPVAAGTYRVIFAATATTTFITLNQNTNAADVWSDWDNISVRELPGNHAYQSTSASRPTLRARYNLLTYSEDQSNGAWVNYNATQQSNVAVAPNGTNTADRIVEASGSGIQARYQAIASGLNTLYTVSAYAKADQRNVFNLNYSGIGAANWFAATFELTGNGSVTKTGAGASGTYTSSSITPVGDGWYFCTVTGSPGQASTHYIYEGPSDTNNPTYGNFGVLTYTGNTSNGILVWGAQLVPTAVFPSNTYQRVGAATDYTTGSAFPPYLFFDGTDDSMLTNSVDFATVTSDGQARRNLLSVPTLFNDTTGWAVARAAIAVSTAVSPPAGISNLFKLTEDTTASNTHQFLSFSDTTVVNGTRYVSSIYAHAAERSWIALQEGQGVTATAYFDLATGAIGTISGTGSPTASIENIGSGWYRCSVSWVASGTAARVRAYLATGDNGAVYTGDGTSGVYLSAAQLETGSTATAFQNIGTDKMLVVAGVTKNSDAAAGVLTEFTADINGNNGSFIVTAPSGAGGANYLFGSKGTIRVDATGTATFAAPVSSVVCGIGDIAGDVATLRVNGSQNATNAANQGTGNYANAALFIGRRNNATLPFNGNIYSLVIAGAAYSAGQISSTESYVAAKTPLGTI